MVQLKIVFQIAWHFRATAILDAFCSPLDSPWFLAVFVHLGNTEVYLMILQLDLDLHILY